ncbi:type I restriction endonuclease [Falsibacillus pallidus]|uniref:Restriction endonuclease type I HsdR N-terminal domain-containing protein n=1 Tax=Falsibacillus pallidus TaxID=493781 RepID=A0A370GWU1_9BACI|nr:type I restriction endonuclease [Falsibacillus pallidus]RDI48011.1 hypothetical protein DFR59_101680 [Falsibacillus pallidus]
MEQFTEQLKTLSKRVNNLKNNLMTEEATKTSIIMPLFQVLGYDIFNPEEFLPEFIADVGIKKGEKVDFAIMQNGAPSILIEAKSINEKLQKHDSQLFRYFGTTSAKFAILTNGLHYRFYTDLEEQNKMDTTPFFEFFLDEIKDIHIAELAKFRKSNFDLDNILNTASELKYTGEIKNFLNEQWEIPSDDFVSLILSHVYNGKKTKNVIDKFQPLVKKSLKQFINEMVNDKIQAAIKNTDNEEEVSKQVAVTVEVIEPEKKDEPQIETTEEEIQGFTIVKMMLKDFVDEDRICYRDNLSYFNILLDDNIRKWICRLWFNSPNKSIQFNDSTKTQISLEKISDIMNLREKLEEVTSKFLVNQKHS